MKHNKRKQIRPKYILVLLAALCILGIALNIFKGVTGSAGSSIVNSLFAPMQRGIDSLGRAASDFSGSRRDRQALESELAQYQDENDILKSRLSVMENNQKDYEDILSLLDLEAKYPNYEMTGARIIAKDPGSWYSTFTINKGSLNGIAVDMNVIADDGLVGIVTKVSPNSAIVRSIIDDSSNVSGMISKNYDICIVSGDLTQIDSAQLTVDMISADSTVVSGDEVVTSYISDKYLPGIRIGYITEVQPDDSGMSIHGKLTPVADFQHLSTVLVIRQLKSDLTAQYDLEDESAAQE